MTVIMPLSRPRLSAKTALETVERLLLNARDCHGPAIVSDCPVVVLAVRGYYRDTMGKPRVNDFGIYDDAGFLCDLGRREMVPFNWNCDPVRAGWNKDVHKYFAQLCPGVWPFRQGPHKGVPNHFRQLTQEEAYEAPHDLRNWFQDLRHSGLFQVRRCSTTTVFATEWGYQAINIHEGTDHGTSSWGCQTLPPAQWKDFQKRSYAMMERSGQKWLPYVLTEERVG